MITLAVILGSLLLIALLRFGVIVEYNEKGFKLWAKAAFLKFKIIGDDVKKKEKKPKKKKDKKEKPPKDKVSFKEMIPGLLKEYKNIFRAIFKTLGRFKRKLLIKQLTVHFVSASEDPYNTAMVFGASNAVYEAVIRHINTKFRVRRFDLRSWFDFTAAEQTIYVKVIVSIAVWEVFYVVFALFPLIGSLFRVMPKKKKDNLIITDGKDDENNGKTTNK